MILKLLASPLRAYLEVLGTISDATGWRSKNDPKNPYHWNHWDRQATSEPMEYKDRNYPLGGYEE